MELTQYTIAESEQCYLQNLNMTYFQHNPAVMTVDHFLNHLYFMNYLSDFQNLKEIEKMLTMLMRPVV